MEENTLNKAISTIIDKTGNELKIDLDGKITVNQGNNNEKVPWHVELSSEQYREFLKRSQIIHDQLVTQVRGLFDSFGNAISSVENFDKRHLLTSATSQVSTYTHEGKHFSSVIDINLSNKDVAIVLIRNPLGSKKNFLIEKVTYFAAGSMAVFYWMSAPTIVNVGLENISKVNRKIGSKEESMVKMYSSSKISNGTIFHKTVHFHDTPPLCEKWNQDLILPENNTIVLMGSATAINTTATVILQWIEV